MITRIATLLLALSLSPANGEPMKLAVTTSFHNSGLSDVLLPRIQTDTGIEVQLLVVGTGQAIRLGQAGDVDAILVHSRAAEDAFVAAGHGTHRREIMYNDFVVIGPAGDPANTRASESVFDAFASIAREKALFVSRGDNSGTHTMERALWAQVGQVPEDFGSWYKPVGAGMGAALNTASGLDAYILSDRASWLKFGNKGDLALLFSGDPALFNQYGYLPVNPERHPHVNADAAQSLEDWLVSDAARVLIDGYRIKGQAAFVFNAMTR